MSDRSEDSEMEELIRRTMLASARTQAPNLDPLKSAFLQRDARSRVRAPQWRMAYVSRPLVIGLVSLLAGLGVISGAVAADALPGPTRTVAYDLGLPVSSPSLVAAQAAESQLRSAIVRRDRRAVVNGVVKLSRSLGALDAADLRRIDPSAQATLRSARSFLTEPTQTTEPTQKTQTTERSTSSTTDR